MKIVIEESWSGYTNIDKMNFKIIVNREKGYFRVIKKEKKVNPLKR